MDEREKTEILKMAFDALPALVFVVDQKMRIQEYNAAAADLAKAERSAIIAQRAGDILYCVHSTEVPEGCGRSPTCRKCIIRNSVTEAFQGNRVIRRRSKIELIRDGKETMIYGLITASPFIFRDRLHALLVIEDINELAVIQRLVSICSVCKKIRDDKQSWMRVESYFKENWGVDFTHGYCPDCYADLLAKVETHQKILSAAPTVKEKTRH